MRRDRVFEAIARTRLTASLGERTVVLRMTTHVDQHTNPGRLGFALPRGPITPGVDEVLVGGDCLPPCGG